jgi:probable O-glycosylation ligase (exosortase A-associated)
MPIRDLLITALVLVSVPFCLLRPWIGVLVWLWISCMNPHRLTWGFAYEFPFALLVAAATLLGFVLTSDRKRFVWSREIVVLLLLWGWFGVTTLVAVYPEAAWDKFVEFSKIILMGLLAISLFQDRDRLRALLLVIAGSFGFYGLKGGLFVLGSGGQWMVLGPPGAFFGANTELALVLNMSLPILLYLAREEPRGWARVALWATFVLTMLAVPFTYSRGGVLGLAVVLMILFLKARRRLLLIPLVIGALFVFALFTPQKWVSRVQTLEDIQADESAQLRMMSWRVAMMIAEDRPITGGGFRVFLHRTTYDMYMPEYPRHFGHDAHSIYFNLLGEHGWVGLGLFVLLVGLVLLRLHRMRKLAREAPELAWIGNYAHMIQASLLAYLATGAFISVAYFDLAYQLIILVPVLQVMATREQAVVAPKPANLSVQVGSATPAKAR